MSDLYEVAARAYYADVTGLPADAPHVVAEAARSATSTGFRAAVDAVVAATRQQVADEINEVAEHMRRQVERRKPGSLERLGDTGVLVGFEQSARIAVNKDGDP